MVYFDPRENYLPDKALPNALLAARRNGDWLMFMGGVCMRPITRTDEDGRFEFVALGTTAEVPPHKAQMCLEPYVVERGRITWAPDFGELGKASYPITTTPVQKEMELTCVAFRCKSLEIYNLFDPRNYNYLSNLQVLEAESNSVPPVYGTTFVEPGWFSYQAPTVTVFAPPGTRLKMTAGAGPLQKRLALLNVRDDAGEDGRASTGDGFAIDDTPAIRCAYLQGARDLWRLNESRVSFFRRHGIENARVNSLHGLAGEALGRAEEALDDKRYREYFTEARRALSLESRAYPDVVGMANDTVRGLVFYLALLLPFAFTMERLFVAGRRIEIRILGVMGFFMAMFFALRLTHPAFQIVLSPMVVLLGFVISVLSTVVILIVMGKLDSLVSRQKVEQLGEHESGVQAISSLTLAIEMGIANMRRRRARTILTSITLVVLTFSVLSFASVTAQIRLQRYAYDEGATPYEGLLLRTKNWAPFPFETYASLRNELADTCILAPRRWYYGHLVLNQSSIDIRMEDRIRMLRALIGLSPQEREVMDVESVLIGDSRWLSESAPGDEPRPEVLVPVSLAKTLLASKDEADSGDLEDTDPLGITQAILGKKVRLLAASSRWPACSTGRR